VSFLVVLVVEREAVAGFAWVGFLADRVRVRANDLGNLSDDVGEVLVFAEEEDRCFRVAPTRVAEELVDRARQAAGSVPEFAFGDEEVLVLVPDEDVGFAVAVEGLA
jgi:hypothetical protein